MPRNPDLKKILLLGSGPIVIGQGCEFDYSGVQACKALAEEGYEVVLLNSNPATIMTDPEFAARTYIEPITVEIIEKIIAAEKPDALLPTLGGQTALNAAMDLYHAGILDKYGVKLIGANADAIAKGEDRQLFKDAMLKIGLDVARSGVAHTTGRCARDRPAGGHLSAHHPSGLHARRAGRRHRLQQGGIRHHRHARAGPLAGQGSARRGIAAGLEGIRDGGHARPRGQLRARLLHRELRSHGRPHGRLHHGRAHADAHATGNSRSCATPRLR